MTKLVLIVFGLIVVGGCTTGRSRIGKEDNNMKTLTIRWQRLVDERGQTCQRCASTEKEVEKALDNLKQSLARLGIEVTLEKAALDPLLFIKDPSESNRIWIGQRPLEEWLNAEVGQSYCCGPCGVAECRTVEVEGQTYETIPAGLIIKAGLLAASRLLDVGANDPCCERTPTEVPSSGCRSRFDSNSKGCR